MRHYLCLAIVLVSSASFAFVNADETVTQPNASAADVSRVARGEEKQLIQALSRQIKLDCDDVELNEAVHQLSELIKQDILFDAIGLTDEGISLDEKVRIQLGEITAWQWLHFVLKPFQLTWIANDGIIEITTEKHAEEVFVTRVYDVRNLCKILEPLTREMFVAQRRGKPQPVRAGGGFFSVPPVAFEFGVIGQLIGGMGGMGGGGFVKPKPVVPKSAEAVLADVIRACSGMIWEDDADDAGSIQLGQGCLIVRQTYRGQFEIAGMLLALEQLLSGKIQGKSIAAARLGYPFGDDAAIFEILGKPTTIEFQEEPLGSVLSQIAMKAGIRLWVDEKELIHHDVSVDQPLTPRRRMQKLPLGICLKKILEPLHLAFVVEEGVLVVTDQTAVAEAMTVRFFDISGITRIATEDRDSGVVAVLGKSTHGMWSELHGNGGSAALVSTRHLAVRQTQQVHAEIALLIDDLTTDELSVPNEPVLEIRVYTAPDAETARDLEKVLPKLLEARWNPRGSIRQAGASLFINQTLAAHDRLDEILQKLDQSNQQKVNLAK